MLDGDTQAVGQRPKWGEGSLTELKFRVDIFSVMQLPGMIKFEMSQCQCWVGSLALDQKPPSHRIPLSDITSCPWALTARVTINQTSFFMTHKAKTPAATLICYSCLTYNYILLSGFSFQRLARLKRGWHIKPFDGTFRMIHSNKSRS